MSKELEEKLENLFQKNEIVDRHSYFQLKYFIIGKEPTTQAKLWRCLRELESRKNSMSTIKMEIEELKDQLELLKIKQEQIEQIKGLEQEIEKRRHNRKKLSIEANLRSLEKKFKFIVEEAQFFLVSFEALEKKEALKPFDDFNAQATYWNEKLTQELNLKLLLHSPVDTELVKTILSLDNEMPIKKSTINILTANKFCGLNAPDQQASIQRKK